WPRDGRAGRLVAHPARTDGRPGRRSRELRIAHPPDRGGDPRARDRHDRQHGAPRLPGEAPRRRGHPRVGARPRREAGGGAVTEGAKALRNLEERIEKLERAAVEIAEATREAHAAIKDRKSTRLNSSHVKISYAVF